MLLKRQFTNRRTSFISGGSANERPALYVRGRPFGPKKDVTAVVLADGRSRRMGQVNKLLQGHVGVPLIRRGIKAAQSSKAAEIIVDTGHQAGLIAKSLSELDVTLALNPD